MGDWLLLVLTAHHRGETKPFKAIREGWVTTNAHMLREFDTVTKNAYKNWLIHLLNKPLYY